MIKPDDLIQNLQEKSYKTRVRILWVITAVVGLGLIVLLGVSLKGSFKSLSGKPLFNTTSSATTPNPVSHVSYINVERIDSNSSGFKIYFNVDNSTDNIMNFSTLTDITLIVNSTTYGAKQITDRQGSSFAQKILSHTQNFGILTFAPLDGDTGSLNFDNLSFENSSTGNFRQEIPLNFKQLETAIDLRN